MWGIRRHRYRPGTRAPGGARLRTPAALALVLLLAMPYFAFADTRVLLGMPRYYWWGGCSPTAGGMIIGYWNSDRFPFYDGDASVWSGASYNSNGSAPTGTAAMVASWEYVHEGELNGWDTSSGRGAWSPAERDANCIADFMNTVNGSTGMSGLITGLEDFAAWDNPETPDLNESVPATTTTSWYCFGADDVWAAYIAEIEARRPVLVNLSRSAGGHSVAGYGYIDNSGTSSDYFAVMDTWSPGLSQAPPGAYIDGNGVEWWPWRPYDGTYNSTYDWRVDFQVEFYADPIPEPATLALLLAGGAALVVRCRRSHRKS